MNKEISIFVQLAIKYRQNNVHCTARSTSSEHTLLQSKYTCIRQNKYCTSSVCLSVPCVCFTEKWNAV